MAKYAEAIKLLDQAEKQIASARILRDRLVATVEVSVLDEWLDRDAAYDVALRNLYKAISKVGTKVTAATQAAVKAEATARARLPPDGRGLVVIMAEIGRGGMNGAVIAIEEARAKLTDALESGTPRPSDVPEPTDTP
jgi:ribosomal protein L12E/L44/L45/RPP1/RPP2